MLLYYVCLMSLSEFCAFPAESAPSKPVEKGRDKPFFRSCRTEPLSLVKPRPATGVRAVSCMGGGHCCILDDAAESVVLCKKVGCLSGWKVRSTRYYATVPLEKNFG